MGKVRPLGIRNPRKDFDQKPTIALLCVKNGDFCMTVPRPEIWGTRPPVYPVYKPLHAWTDFSKLYVIIIFLTIRAMAHGDCCFFAPCTNVLTDLLIYCYY